MHLEQAFGMEAGERDIKLTELNVFCVFIHHQLQEFLTESELEKQLDVSPLSFLVPLPAFSPQSFLFYRLPGTLTHTHIGLSMYRH